jgi:hypothetical protein
MKQRLYCLNQMRSWCGDEAAVIENCSEQYDVYGFDADECRAACSATKLYAMHPFYGAFRLKTEDARDPWHADADEEILESVKEDIQKYMRTDVLYVKCSSVDVLAPHYKRGELPEELPDEFVIIWDDNPTEDYEDCDTMDSFLSDVEGDWPL